MFSMNLDSAMSGMFVASDNRKDGKINVLIISSGSVASIKIPLIVDELYKVRQAFPLILNSDTRLILAFLPLLYRTGDSIFK
jgi:hypothetical protein